MSPFRVAPAQRLDKLQHAPVGVLEEGDPDRWLRLWKVLGLDMELDALRLQFGEGSVHVHYLKREVTPATCLTDGRRTRILDDLDGLVAIGSQDSTGRSASPHLGHLPVSCIPRGPFVDLHIATVRQHGANTRKGSP